MSSKFVSRGADRYDAYMGRWSRRLAEPFLDFAGLAAGERVLDAGCGTGSLTFALPARADVAAIDAIDYEPQFVEAARERNSDPRINFQQGDACNLKFGDGAFDRALSMLVLHFVADPERAIAEMRRVVRPGGVAAATVWDNYGGQPSIRMFYDTLAAIEPRAIDKRNAGLIRPMTLAGELYGAFAKAGFADVTETTIVVRMDFQNFEDYWIPQTTGQGTIAEFLGSLTNDTRRQIETAMRAAYLCGQPDGPRSFVSVAWAVRGVVPAKS
jgi:ubiquinone/menaquinone biosynthesis C-methylase UbiE